MTSTTDFEEWLQANDPEGHEEIYSLFCAVEAQETHGIWDVQTRGQQTLVKGHASTLVLTEKARHFFLKRVEKLKGDTEMDMESWYGYERAMANPKA